ncbi:MAG: hypothetical protein ACOVT5_18210, partial [Armatimonadaceae bacterium]
AFALVGCDVLFPRSDGFRDVAAAKAMDLEVYAKAWSARHYGVKVPELSELADYAEDGHRALIDPWGKQFRFCYVVEPETQAERFVVWTVHPKTGEVIAAPRELTRLVRPPK